MRTYCFIVNPAARKGKGDRILKPLREWIAQAHLNAEIHVTARPGHAQELATLSTASVHVAVGGDGTVQEVANAIVGSEKVLGIIPNGSGNDFVKSIDIPTNSREAFDCLLTGKQAFIDTGTVVCWSGDKDGNRSNSAPKYFVNGVGIGFDAAVAERTRSIKYIGGFALYLLAVLQTLGRYRAPRFRIRTDTCEVQGSKLLIAVGNGRCAGGGFYLTPTARVDDGSFDICMIDDLPVRQILALVPKVMNGRHAECKGVHMGTLKRLQVQASESFYVHADGEIVGRDVNRSEIQLHPSSLKVIVGERFRSTSG